MYNLDPSRGCDFLYDLESGAGKVDCYRITSPDAPLDASAADSNGITPRVAELWVSPMSNWLLAARIANTIG